MCKDCHILMDNSKILKDFKQTLDNPCFELWNDTSISHLLIAGIGVNGKKVRKVSLELLNRCCLHLKSSKALSEVAFPDKFGLSHLTVEQIIFLYEKVKSFPSETYSKKDLKDLVYHKNILNSFINDYKPSSSQSCRIL